MGCSCAPRPLQSTKGVRWPPGLAPLPPQLSQSSVWPQSSSSPRTPPETPSHLPSLHPHLSFGQLSLPLLQQALALGRLGVPLASYAACRPLVPATGAWLPGGQKPSCPHPGRETSGGDTDSGDRLLALHSFFFFFNKLFHFYFR